MRLTRDATVERRAERGPLTFVAATEGRKADGIDLRMSGARLAPFRSNPVVLWSHRYTSPPIGRAVDVRVVGGRLLADVEFDSDDPFAAAIERQYREGFLSAVSAGFEVQRWRDDQPRTGVAEEWTLKEISGVPVPLDAGALVDAGRQAAASVGGRRASRRDLRQLRDALADTQSTLPATLERAVERGLRAVLADQRTTPSARGRPR